MAAIGHETALSCAVPVARRSVVRRRVRFPKTRLRSLTPSRSPSRCISIMEPAASAIAHLVSPDGQRHRTRSIHRADQMGHLFLRALIHEGHLPQLAHFGAPLKQVCAALDKGDAWRRSGTRGAASLALSGVGYDAKRDISHRMCSNGQAKKELPAPKPKAKGIS